MGKHLGVAYNLRLPQELKDKIAESAKELNRSMNADIVARLEESFMESMNTVNYQAIIKVIPLQDGKKRVIHGKLLNVLNLDYNQSLDDLKIDIELALDTLSRTSIRNALRYLIKDAIVAQSNNHLNIVDNRKNCLGWLLVEDLYVSA